MEAGGVSLYRFFQGPPPTGPTNSAGPLLSNPHVPLENDLPPPGQTHSDISKQHLSHVSMNFSTPPQKNLTNYEGVKLALGNALKFAKEHPFLAAGFILGAILIVISFPTLSMALAHTAQITLGHAEITVGLGLGAMFLTYGVTVINMARKAALKDELEAEIKKQPVSRSSSLTDLKTMAETEKLRILREAKKISDESSSSISELSTLNEEMKAKQREQEKSLKELKDLQQKLLETISQDVFKSVSAEQERNEMLKLLKNVGEEIEKGSELILEKIGEEQFPAIEDFILIPSSPSQEQEKNREIQQNIKTGLSALLPSMKTYLKEHPFSVGITVSGVFFVLLAIPMVIFLFKGDSSVVFLGSLSAAGAAQIFMYGASLVYEGYNSLRIETLKKDLKKLEEQIKAEEKIPEERKKIQEQAARSLEEFKNQWKTLLSDAEKMNAKRIEEQEKARDKLIIQCYKALLNFAEQARINTSTLPSQEVIKEQLLAPMIHSSTLFESQS